MRNAGAGRVIIDPVFACERLNLGVLLEVLRRDILNVVIDGEDRLRRIGNRGGSDLLELWNHGAGVVMRHHMARPNRDEISRAHDCTRSEPIRMPCGNFLDEREAHISFSWNNYFLAARLPRSLAISK